MAPKKTLNLEKLVTEYIHSKKDSWSAATLRSEQYRLRGITLEQLMEPELLYKHLTTERELKPYAVKTTFVRAGDFVEFLQERGDLAAGPNPVKRFIEKNAKLFKYVYKPKAVAMTFEQAAEAIATIPDESIRAKAMQLLFTGMRVSESATLDEEGNVIGKGGHARHVPMAAEVPAEEFDSSYSTLYRALKKIGLTPHQLRKLCATRLAADGAQEADLMKAMGWRSSQMAAVYVQAQRQAELTEKMKKRLPAKKGTTKDGK